MERNHVSSPGVSLRIMPNRSFVFSVLGSLQIGVVVFGLLCLSILGSAMTQREPLFYSFWRIGGASFYAFLFLVSFWCFMTSFILVLTSSLSEHTATQLPQTIFYIVFHVMAAIFYLIGTLALLIETAKYTNFSYGNSTNIKSLLFVGGSFGGIVTGLYTVISVFAIGKYIRSSP